jgi:hypothetical protein
MAKTQHTITQTRTAQRYSQIAELERQLALVLANVATAKMHVKELTEAANGLMQRIRTAARDEGELSLFDIEESA